MQPLACGTRRHRRRSRPLHHHLRSHRPTDSKPSSMTPEGLPAVASGAGTMPEAMFITRCHNGLPALQRQQAPPHPEVRAIGRRRLHLVAKRVCKLAEQLALAPQLHRLQPRAEQPRVARVQVARADVAHERAARDGLACSMRCRGTSALPALWQLCLHTSSAKVATSSSSSNIRHIS